jgi:hypothetical protein
MFRRWREFNIYVKLYIRIFYNNNIYQMASRRRNSSSKKIVGKRRRSGKRTEKKTHKWHQRGCQSQTGGGSMTGGWAWGPSDVHHQTAGAPHSINGNHYALNTATVAPPQASNAIVERYAAAQTAGRRRGRGRSGSKIRRKVARKSRRIACQNGGGFMEYMPDIPKIAGNTALQVPSSIVHGLQGPSTGFVSATPTSQPIGEPIALK